MKQIMVATDGSAGADRAVDLAAQLARGLQAELLILTVADELGGGEMRRLAHAEDDIGGAIDSGANQLIADAAARAGREGELPIRSIVAWGDPAKAIIEAADPGKVAMIVVGRRGRGQLKGLLLGSVSQKLTSLAECPVLIVP